MVAYQFSAASGAEASFVVYWSQGFTLGSSRCSLREQA